MTMFSDMLHDPDESFLVGDTLSELWPERRIYNPKMQRHGSKQADARSRLRRKLDLTNQ